MWMKAHWSESYLLVSKVEVSHTLKNYLLFSAIHTAILNLEMWSNTFIITLSIMIKMWSSSSDPNFVHGLIIK